MSGMQVEAMVQCLYSPFVYAEEFVRCTCRRGDDVPLNATQSSKKVRIEFQFLCSKTSILRRRNEDLFYFSITLKVGLIAMSIVKCQISNRNVTSTCVPLD
ncbi:unnamed protein product [Sphenostylis stenocarpa]|uniref:Uncharacterized protein n=1 Tax=Sphenostylis stenocarpa TaxID=92480 RepID=A0AA86SQ63_9FABA|nr:unnamed protein product [Sphenostylis stenocarpa]